MEAKPPIRYRKLRIAWSIGSGILCVLLIALWVRNFWNICDQCWGEFPNGNTLEIDSHSGYVWVGILRGDGSNVKMRWWLTTFQLTKENVQKYRNVPKFRFIRPIVGGNGTCVFAAPHWFLLLLVLAITSIPWFRWRFSLRTLLITTALLAIALGLIIYKIR